MLLNQCKNAQLKIPPLTTVSVCKFLADDEDYNKAKLMKFRLLKMLVIKFLFNDPDFSIDVVRTAKLRLNGIAYIG